MTSITGGDRPGQKHPGGRRILLIVLATALILLVPLVAMQFTDEVEWHLSDFAAAGTLLLGTGLMYELAARKLTHPRHRMLAGIALVTVLLLAWAELAVGVFS